jgi:hypothetical protein
VRTSAEDLRIHADVRMGDEHYGKRHDQRPLYPGSAAMFSPSALLLRLRARRG